MVHRHKWSEVGLLANDGDIKVKRCFCFGPECTAERRINRESKISAGIIPDGFPVDMNGTIIVLEDVPGGGVIKLIMREIVESYDLDNICFEPGDTVLDVGAHVGAVSIYLAKRYPWLRIIAFEPQPGVCKLLHRNLERNDVYNVEVYNVALAGDNGCIDLRYNLAANSGGSSSYISGEGAEVVTARAKSLDTLLCEFGLGRIKLLKLDCEGGEYDVLLNASVLDRIDNLVGEFHENDRLREMGYNGDDLIEYCKRYIENVNVHVIEMAE